MRYIPVWALTIVMAFAPIMAFTPAFATTVEDRDISNTELPGHVQKLVEDLASKQLKPVVVTGADALGEFNKMLVLAYGEQAKLPDQVKWLVFVDSRVTPVEQ